MKSVKTVFVTGGAGFIGSHCLLELLEQGYDVIAVDNFSNAVQASNGGAEALNRVEEMTGKQIPFHNIDICDYDALSNVMKKYQIDCVMHFAAFKNVPESVEKPLLYYRNNLIGALSLLQVMKEQGIQKFIFSSSCTVYGKPELLPITEDSRTGIELSNPYGCTKHMVEQVLTDLCVAEKELKVVLLRYFNPAGAHPSGRIGEDPKGVPNLLPAVAHVAAKRLPHVRVFGTDYDTVDGTGVRDYIHVMDLAKGHAAAVRYIDAASLEGCRAINLGTGTGYSVLQVVTAFERACGFKLPVQCEPRRVGDQATVYCDPSLALTELKWKTELGLDDMCRDLWNFQCKNPMGYAVVDSDTSKTSGKNLEKSGSGAMEDRQIA